MNEIVIDQGTVSIIAVAEQGPPGPPGGGGMTDGDKGDITVSGSGAIWTIDANVVTNAKLSDMATATFKGRTTAGSGDPEDLTVAQAKILLNLAGSNTGDQTITLIGDISGSGTGSFAATIANDAVTTPKIVNDAVTYAKIQNVSTTDKLLGRATAGAGDVEEIACTAAGRALIDDADAAAQRTTLNLGSAATHNKATAGEILAGTADKIVEPDALLSAIGPVALTDGANIAVDLATGVYFTVTLGGNRTLDNPTNHKVGRTIYLKVKQDATGSRALSYGTQYDFGQDTAPTLSTATGLEDLLAFFVASSTKLVYLGIRKDIG